MLQLIFFILSIVMQFEASRIRAIVAISDKLTRQDTAEAYIRKTLNLILGIKLNDDMRDNGIRVLFDEGIQAQGLNNELRIHVRLQSNERSFQCSNDVFLCCLDAGANEFLARVKLGLEYAKLSSLSVCHQEPLASSVHDELIVSGEPNRASIIISNIMKLYNFENPNREVVDTYILSHIEDIYRQRVTLETMGKELGFPFKGRYIMKGHKPIIERYNDIIEYEGKRINLFPKDTRRDDNTRGILFSQPVNMLIAPFIDDEEPVDDKASEISIIELDFDVDEVEPIEIVHTTKSANSDPEYISPRELIGIFHQFASLDEPFGTNCAFHIPDLRKYVNLYQVYVRMLDEPRYKNVVAAIEHVLRENGVIIPHIIRSYRVVDDVIALIKWCVETDTRFDDVEYLNEKATARGKLFRALIDSGYSKPKWISSAIAENKNAIIKDGNKLLLWERLF